MTAKTLISKLIAHFCFPSLCLFTLVLTAAGARADGGPLDKRWAIDNPYASVDWETFEQYKGNLHTHTTHSDGRLNPHDVIDRYHALGYAVLALTDHNAVTYPWNELSALTPSKRSRGRAGKDGPVYENRSAVAVGAKNGLAILYHPGRYDKPLAWYLDLYRRHDHLFGLEVYNQGDRYPSDRKLWDRILTELIPERPVWGYLNDDMHKFEHLGRNWTIFLLPKLSSAHVRQALETGHSYFVYVSTGHKGPKPPRIQSIHVNAKEGTIQLKTTDSKAIVWISGGREVHRGETIHLQQVADLGSYVRVELHGAKGTVTGMQPFGLRAPGHSDRQGPDVSSPRNLDQE